MYQTPQNLTDIIARWSSAVGFDKVSIKSMTINPGKKVVTVVFSDGDVRMSKCQEKDIFDDYVGVALCIAEHLYGTKNKFHKAVRNSSNYIQKDR